MLCLAVTALAACDAGAKASAQSSELGRGGGPRPEPPAAEVPSKPPAAVPSKRLESDQPIVKLPVEGRLDAVVAVPVGAERKRPVLVAAHGRDDTPEPLCQMWRGVVEARGFVICPRGIASQNVPGTWTYASHDALAQEIDDALAALRAKYPDHVDDGPLVYSGFSLGSFQGVRVVTKNPERTPRVVLIEGGHDPWTDDLVETFADGGGQRVLFVTGQAVNFDRSKRVARELEGAGIAARVVHAEGAGHVYTGEVTERIDEAFDWVVEGDDRWKR